MKDKSRRKRGKEKDAVLFLVREDSVSILTLA